MLWAHKGYELVKNKIVFKSATVRPDYGRDAL